MHTTGDQNVRYGVPDRGKGSIPQAGKGRPCEEPGCTTVLSVYNTSSNCWVHDRESKGAIRLTPPRATER